MNNILRAIGNMISQDIFLKEGVQIQNVNKSNVVTFDFEKDGVDDIISLQGISHKLYEGNLNGNTVYLAYEILSLSTAGQNQIAAKQSATETYKVYEKLSKLDILKPLMDTKKLILNNKVEVDSEIEGYTEAFGSLPNPDLIYTEFKKAIIKKLKALDKTGVLTDLVDDIHNASFEFNYDKDTTVRLLGESNVKLAEPRRDMTANALMNLKMHYINEIMTYIKDLYVNLRDDFLNTNAYVPGQSQSKSATGISNVISAGEKAAKELSQYLQENYADDVDILDFIQMAGERLKRFKEQYHIIVTAGIPKGIIKYLLDYADIKEADYQIVSKKDPNNINKISDIFDEQKYMADKNLNTFIPDDVIVSNFGGKTSNLQEYFNNGKQIYKRGDKKGKPKGYKIQHIDGPMRKYFALYDKPQINIEDDDSILLVDDTVQTGSTSDVIRKSLGTDVKLDTFALFATKALQVNEISL